MIGDIFILDKNLLIVGIADAYKSIIWDKKYNDIGECELYMPATPEAFEMLKMGYYIARNDDDMVCRIKLIQLNTDAEEGNYLIVKGFDAKGLLDQRVIWGTATASGNKEEFMRELVKASVIDSGILDRKMLKENGDQLIYLGEAAGFPDALSEQVSYKNIGEAIRNYCASSEWGYRLILKNSAFLFEIYKGEDKAQSVIFSEDYENINTTSYVEDFTNLGNVALIAGEGQGSERKRNIAGKGSGVDRYEVFVDSRNLSETVTFGDLKAAYPLIADGGYGRISDKKYILDQFDVNVLDNAQLAELKNLYPSPAGEEIIIDGVLYYRIYNFIAATLPSNNPQDGENVKITALVYQMYLLASGYETLAAYGAVTSFDGAVEPETTFVYKKDYDMGDVVTVKNEYGIQAVTRIIEVVEVSDDNGYSVEPKFEYKET